MQDIIEVMLDQGVTISQNEVARVAGVSVGFINKHLQDVVERAKQRQQKLLEHFIQSVSLLLKPKSWSG